MGPPIAAHNPGFGIAGASFFFAWLLRANHSLGRKQGSPCHRSCVPKGRARVTLVGSITPALMQVFVHYRGYVHCNRKHLCRSLYFLQTHDKNLQHRGVGLKSYAAATQSRVGQYQIQTFSISGIRFQLVNNSERYAAAPHHHQEQYLPQQQRGRE